MESPYLIAISEKCFPWKQDVRIRFVYICKTWDIPLSVTEDMVAKVFPTLLADWLCMHSNFVSIIR